MAQLVKNLPMIRETWVQSLGREDPLEKGMAIYSSILAWRIPWTEEHLPCIGLVKKFIWEFKNLKKMFGQPNIYLPQISHAWKPNSLTFVLSLLHNLQAPGKESKRVEEKIFPFPKRARKWYWRYIQMLWKVIHPWLSTNENNCSRKTLKLGANLEFWLNDWSHLPWSSWLTLLLPQC